MERERPCTEGEDNAVPFGARHVAAVTDRPPDRREHPALGVAADGPRRLAGGEGATDPDPAAVAAGDPAARGVGPAEQTAIDQAWLAESRDRLQAYREGKLKAEDGEATTVQSILDAHTPVDPLTRRKEYADAGWTGYDPRAEPYDITEAERERIRAPYAR